MEGGDPRDGRAMQKKARNRQFFGEAVSNMFNYLTYNNTGH